METVVDHIGHVEAHLAGIGDAAQCDCLKVHVQTLRATQTAMLYSVTCVIAGYGPGHQRDVNMQRHLKEMMKDDVAAKLPLACAWVVNKEMRMPGGAFFEAARDLGFTIAATPAAERAFWEEQIRAAGGDPLHLHVIEHL